MSQALGPGEARSKSITPVSRPRSNKRLYGAKSLWQTHLCRLVGRPMPNGIAGSDEGERRVVVGAERSHDRLENPRREHERGKRVGRGPTPKAGDDLPPARVEPERRRHRTEAAVVEMAEKRVDHRRPRTPGAADGVADRDDLRHVAAREGDLALVPHGVYAAAS